MQTRLFREGQWVFIFFKPNQNSKSNGLTESAVRGIAMTQKEEKASEAIPGSRTFAELAWAAVPDTFVRHDCELSLLGGRSAASERY